MSVGVVGLAHRSDGRLCSACDTLACLFTDGGDAEISAWACGCFGVAMSDDVSGRDAVLELEEGDQFCERLHLFGRRRAVVKVSDEADSDAEVVVAIVGGFGVGAVLLFCPARADLYASVGSAFAVVDDEVIAEFVPALGAVIAIEFLCRSEVGGAVMNDDPSPGPGWDGGDPSRLARQRTGGRRVGDRRGDLRRGDGEIGFDFRRMSAHRRSRGRGWRPGPAVARSVRYRAGGCTSA